MPEESIIRIIIEGSGPGQSDQPGNGSGGPLNGVVSKITGGLVVGAAAGAAAGVVGQAGLDRSFMIGSGSFEAIRTANVVKGLTGSGTGVNPYWVGGLQPNFDGAVFNQDMPFKTPSQVETIVGWGAKGTNGKGVFFYKNYGDLGRLNRDRKYRRAWDIISHPDLPPPLEPLLGDEQFLNDWWARFENQKVSQSVIDTIMVGNKEGTTGFFKRPGNPTSWGPLGAPTSSVSSTGGIIREGYQLNKASQAMLRSVTTPSVGSSMRLLRAGGIAGGGLAIALGISAYINNARQDAVMTAAAEGRDATGGEVLRSVSDKISSHIDGVGSFFQKVIAGVASAPGKLVGNFGVGWAALSGDGSGAAEANKYAEDVDEYWSEAIGLKSTRQKRWAASKKFNEVRDHTKWLASEQTELAIRRNAESFADSYIHLGIATHNELRTLYESEMTTRIREKYSKQAMDEFDKTHNRTTFIRAQLASQGD